MSSAPAKQRSESAAVCAWIERLPAGTWFRSAAVPGGRHLAGNILARLLAEPQPIIGRACRGIYWRQPPPVSPLYGKVPLLTGDAVSVLGPPGSGYAQFGALNLIGWSTQKPYRIILAVPYRNLTPPRLGRVSPEFVERSNRRRRDLNWNEANLLEAARFTAWADYHSWDHAMWLLTETNGWMKQGAPIRKQRVLWAAETEPRSRGSVLSESENRRFADTLARLERDLPDLVERS